MTDRCPKCGAAQPHPVGSDGPWLYYTQPMHEVDGRECLRHQLEQAEERASVVPLLARFFTAVVDPRAHWTHCHVVPDLECWYCKHEDLIAEILTHADQVKALAQLKAPNAPERQIQARGEVGPPSLTSRSSEGDTRPLRASEGPERAFCEEGRG